MQTRLMASYLVTGGAGFIGSHLAEELVRRGHRVRVVDSLITGKRRNLEHIAGVEFVEGDLADLDVAARAVRGHRLRAAPGGDSVGAALGQGSGRRRTAPTSTRSLNVLVAARDAGVKRLVYAGSSSAYGDTPTLPKREDMPTSPLSPYALQKLVAEQYCQMFTQLYGFETVTIRYFNVFGPRQDPGSPYSGVISLFATALLEGRQPDDLRRRRADARLHLRRQRRRRRAARLRGAARGRRSDQRRDRRPHLAQRAAADDERDRRHRASSRSTSRARAGDVRDSQADITKAKALLGYAPIVGLEEGLAQTIAWCRTLRL